VSGYTINPLVVGPNITTRSDARIFSSDGNVTMKALAHSASLFSSTCASLIARMLNTVPRTVTLTEVLEPLPVKPTDLSLIMHANNGSFSLSGDVRVRLFLPHSAEISHSPSPQFWNLDAKSDATVRLLWADRSGKPCTGCAVQLEPLDGENVGISFVGNHTSLWFQIPWPGLDVSPAGISHFWFEITENGKTWVENQDGSGFPLQTDILVSDSSCTTSFPPSGRIDIAVS
jgi:hypothetical protein